MTTSKEDMIKAIGAQFSFNSHVSKPGAIKSDIDNFFAGLYQGIGKAYPPPETSQLSDSCIAAALDEVKTYSPLYPGWAVGESTRPAHALGFSIGRMHAGCAQDRTPAR